MELSREISHPGGLSRITAWIWVVAAVVWAAAIAWWIYKFATLDLPHRGWLVDWHVYAAGANDLLAGTLYQVPLESPYRSRLAVPDFNYPPGAALIAIPFLAVPDHIGGYAFVVVNIAAIAITAVLTAWIVKARPMWLWAGAAFLLYSVFREGQPLILGNNTPLVLLFVAGAVAAHQSKRAPMAGALLGLAIATKLWPATLLVVLARERSWPTVGWAVGTAAVIIGGSLLWLGGPGVVGPMVSALRHEVEITRQVLLGITWLRENLDWWPVWGGYAVTALLLIIPARGLTGYGLGTLAGLAAIPNLWIHYLGSIIFGLVLLVAGLLGLRRERSSGAQPVQATADEPSPT